MITPEQREARKNGLGSSDAGTVCGVNPYKTPAELWMEKCMGVTEALDSEPIEWGNRLERPILEAYAEKTGETIDYPQDTIYHPEHKQLFCHLDGLRRDQIGVEAKNIGPNTAKEWGPVNSQRLPEQYLCQVAHNANITGIKRWDIAVLICGQDFRIYPVTVPDGLCAEIEQIELEFWDFVASRKAPPLDREPYKAIQKLYPQELPDKIVLANDEIMKTLWRYKYFDDWVKARTTQRDEMKARITEYMRDAGELQDVFGKTLATWKKSKDTTGIDWEALARDLYKRFQSNQDQEKILNDFNDLVKKHTVVTRKGSRKFNLKDLGEPYGKHELDTENPIEPDTGEKS